MAPKGTETSVEIRELIISLYCKGNSMRAVGEMVSRPHSTVQDIINRWRYEGRVKNKHRNGRPSILSVQDKRTIIRKVTKNPRTSVPKLTVDISKMIGRPISVESVRNVLREDNLHGRSARKKPYISEANRKKRLEFAKRYIAMPNDFWSTILFTDETKINLFGSDGRQIVWRKPNSALKQANIIPTVKHGGGNVLLWGSMAASGAGSIEFINTNMDKMLYLEILKKNMKHDVEKLGISNNFHFQQDNDPKHTARIVQEWLLYNAGKLLKTPPQSPDLNPIEHLWKEIKNRLEGVHCSNKEELKKNIMLEWRKIPSTFTKKLVDSMPRRLQAVIDANGGHTKY